jgi:putative phosphoesterase
MKILLLSDNHAHCDSGILKHVNWADEVWHAGDWLNLDLHHEIIKLGKPIVGVYGNVDGVDVRGYYPEFQHFEREGMRIFMTHIAGKPGKYPARILQEAQKTNPQIFICGHSHILLVKNDPSNKWLHLNPGAVGLHGFHAIRTALRFEIQSGSIGKLEIVEWARKQNTEIM